MKVVNVHCRRLAAAPQRVGPLIDALASPDDRIWRRTPWPRLVLDRPLGEGARGGHGPIGYSVERYVPGRLLRFRFTAPRGLDGWHGVEVREEGGGTLLEHRIEMRLRGVARLTWPLLFQPLHDALIEDVLSQAQRELGEPPAARRWSYYVRLLRRLSAPLARRTMNRGNVHEH